MDTVVEEIIESKRIKHKIMCDLCGKLISEEIECDDGYYRNFEYEWKVDADDFYVYRKQLCDECVPIISKKIGQLLKSFGFKKE